MDTEIQTEQKTNEQASSGAVRIDSNKVSYNDKKIKELSDCRYNRPSAPDAAPGAGVPGRSTRP